MEEKREKVAPSEPAWRTQRTSSYVAVRGTLKKDGEAQVLGKVCVEHRKYEKKKTMLF